MAFYISPPSGQIAIEDLFHLAKCRLSFLRRLLFHINTKSANAPWEDAAFVQESEAVIEMTPRDTLSHFLLRICAGFNKTFARFFIDSEIWLFRTRHEHFSEAEKLRSYKWIKKQVKHVTRRNNPESLFSEFFMILLSIVQQLEKSLKNPDKIIFKVPFKYVLDLVSQRVVALSGGIAHVDKSLLDRAWTGLYKFYLELALQHQAHSRMLDDIKGDPRIMAAVDSLLEEYLSTSGSTTSYNFECASIRADQVDRLESRFPLCMQHLHQKLRLTHRLQHHSRIQYTLFLKEAGLPLQEALVFWSQEYEQNPDVNQRQSLCSHHWKNDSGRYVYSIRHLYGAEGNRKDYSAHTCWSLQSSSRSSTETGGCPFTVFDAEHLNHLMDNLEPKDRQDILEINMKSGPQLACRKYYNSQVSVTLQNKPYEMSDLTMPHDSKSNRSTFKTSGSCDSIDQTDCDNSCRSEKYNTDTFKSKTIDIATNEEKTFLKPVDYFKSFSKLLEDMT